MPNYTKTKQFHFEKKKEKKKKSSIGYLIVHLFHLNNLLGQRGQIIFDVCLADQHLRFLIEATVAVKNLGLALLFF